MRSSNTEPSAMAGLDDKGVTEVAAEALASIGSQVSLTADAAAELARAAVNLADQRVRERPWQAAAAAGAVGVLVGLLLRRH